MFTVHARDVARIQARSVLAAVTVLGLAVATSQAAVIPDSEGYFQLHGNNPSYNTGPGAGSFLVDVAYEMYDGKDASDPLHVTDDIQIVFALHHVGGDGETPVRNFKKFYVYSPEPSPFYSSINFVNPSEADEFLIGPSGHEIDPYNGVVPHRYNSNIMYIENVTTIQRERGIWYFTTTAGETADFLSGQYSQMLVLTASASEFTAHRDIVIQIDGTNSVPSFSADTTITLVPEPCTIMLLLVPAATWLSRRRR